MIKVFAFPLALLICMLPACLNQAPQPGAAQPLKPQPCTDAWYQSVESAIPSGDGMGHGPDLGSDEWRSVIEFKLGIRGNPEIPERKSPDWCNYIDNFIQPK